MTYDAPVVPTVQLSQTLFVHSPPLYVKGHTPSTLPTTTVPRELLHITTNARVFTAHGDIGLWVQRVRHRLRMRIHRNCNGRRRAQTALIRAAGRVRVVGTLHGLHTGNRTVRACKHRCISDSVRAYLVPEYKTQSFVHAVLYSIWTHRRCYQIRTMHTGRHIYAVKQVTEGSGVVRAIEHNEEVIIFHILVVV